MEAAGLLAILLFGLLNTLVLWMHKKPLLPQVGALALSLLLYRLSPILGLLAFPVLEGIVFLRAYHR